MDRREPQIHEVWAFGEDGVMGEVCPTAQVDVGTGVVGEFTISYLTEIWRRIPSFGIIPINGSVEWLIVPDFHGTDGPDWTANLLAPRSSWVYGFTTTNKNRGSQSEGASGIVSVPWNRPVRVLTIYRPRISENMRAAARRVHDNHL